MSVFNGRCGKRPVLNGRRGKPPVFNGRRGKRPVFNGRRGKRPALNGRCGKRPVFNGRCGKRPVFNGRRGKRPVLSLRAAPLTRPVWRKLISEDDGNCSVLSNSIKLAEERRLVGRNTRPWTQQSSTQPETWLDLNNMSKYVSSVKWND